jgi:hypothetical protein
MSDHDRLVQEDKEYLEYVLSLGRYPPETQHRIYALLVRVTQDNMTLDEIITEEERRIPRRGTVQRNVSAELRQTMQDARNNILYRLGRNPSYQFGYNP